MQDMKPAIAALGAKKLAPLILACALVLLIYVWFISAGTWFHWPKTSNYYGLLAESFRQGQLSLQAKPDPALLALPDPYDPKARKNVSFLSDASLYEGKYYLYWGPVPSLILDAWMSILSGVPGDQYVTFLFMAGTFLFEAGLILSLWRRSFPSLPQWLVLLAILLAGLAGPFTRMLVHPLIYEASIAGGQFFLLGGFFFACSALTTSPAGRGRLFLAGLFWVCAVGTRTLQIIPIAMLVVLVLVLLFLAGRSSGTPGKSIWLPTGALLLPLFAGGFGLAWYNWARFHSIFEFGYYYQLAGFNMQSFYHILFSRVYILQNLYNYLLNPFQMSMHFPFTQPLAGNDQALFPSYNLPDVYVVEGKIAGLLWSFPFLIFALLPPVRLVWAFLRSLRHRVPGVDGDRWNFSSRLDLGLTLCFLGSFVPTMMFFFAATRYMGDFFTFLCLLAIVGFWEIYTHLNQPPYHKITVALGSTLAVYSILITTLLAFATRLSWFTSFNPGMMDFLRKLFGS